jgi:hypothetical protein
MLLKFTNGITKESIKKIVDKQKTIGEVKSILTFDFRILKMNFLIKNAVGDYIILSDNFKIEDYPLRKGSEIIVSPLTDTENPLFGMVSQVLSGFFEEVCPKEHLDYTNHVSIDITLYEDTNIGSDITLYAFNMDKRNINDLLFGESWELCIMYREAFNEQTKMITFNNESLRKYKYAELRNTAIEMIQNRCDHSKKDIAIKILKEFKHWVKLPFTFVSCSEDGEHNKDSVNLYKMFYDLDNIFNNKITN